MNPSRFFTEIEGLTTVQGSAIHPGIYVFMSVIFSNMIRVGN